MIATYINWNLDPEIIKIFGVSIRYYGLIFVVGVILSFNILSQLCVKESISPFHLDELTVYGLIGIVVGARVGHCLFYESAYYLSHPLEVILPVTFLPSGGIKFIGYQGLASHGGLLGLLTALSLHSRKNKFSIAKTLDLIAIVSGLSFGLIRIGNFMNSEIIGTPTTKPWAVIFERVDNLPRHPAQLYEAISYFIIFMLMMIIYHRKKGHLKNGFFFGLGCVLFFTIRFLIEFVKEGQVGFENGMTLNIGQLLSLPFIAAGVGLTVYGVWRTKPSRKHLN